LITCQRDSYDGSQYQNRVIVVAVPL